MLEIKAHLVFEPLEGCRTVHLTGSEGMNELSVWTMRVVSDDGAVDLEKCMAAGAEIAIADLGEGQTRQVGTIVAAISYEGEERQGHVYELTLVPPEWVLTQRHGYQIFQGKTTQEIVTKLLADSGIDGPRVVWRLMGTYVARPYCVQYDETEWAFCERLLADDGISYWFDWIDDKPVIVFGDHADAYDGVEEPTVIPFQHASGMATFRHFHELELSEEVVTEGAHVREYDVKNPDVLIEGKAGKTGKKFREYFEFPACVPTEKIAGLRAQARLEQLQRFQFRARGASDCARVHPGRRFKLEGTADELFEQVYLVVRTHHRFVGAPNLGERHGVTYSNDVDMVPLKKVAHRPAIATVVPKIEGIETAITTGPGSEEIHVDDLGSLKIRYKWDRSGILDDKSSVWMRSMQMAMGGAMVIPRVGWEVPVMYADGNPDRPLVLGRIYNAEGVVPYSLPGGSATTAMQSATSPGDGTTNEIRMGDSGGKQEFFVHASKDQSVYVGGSRKITISANQTHDVTLSLTVDVKASQTHSVGANQTVNVTTDYSTKVHGGRNETVGAMEAWKVGANRRLNSSGAYIEAIGALYGLQCNQANTDVKGGYAQMLGAKMGHTCGLGFSESIAGARGINVGGSRSIIAGKAFGEKVTGIKKISAGASSVKAAGVKTVGKATGKIKAASATVTADGAIVIGAPKISLKIGGSITCPAMTIGGGTLKITKGSSLINGTIKRQGGSEIE